MLVRELYLEGFMNHNRTHVELPSTGVTVVTGGNGEGKSTLIEAVAYAHWGKTLRGTTPWRDGEKGQVRVLSDQLEVKQSVTKKGAKKLTWMSAGEEKARKFDRQTDAKRVLAEEVGDFDLWRRLHVFSSADAAHFSSATDKERKELIERMLGMEVFDRALEACRVDRRTAVAKLEKVKSEAMYLAGQLESLKAVLAQWETPEPFEEEPEPAPPEYEVDPKVLPELRAELLELQERRTRAGHRMMATVPEDLVVATQSARMSFNGAVEKLARVKSGKCSECDRPFEAVDEEEVSKAVRECETRLRDFEAAERAAREDVVATRASAKDEMDEIDERRRVVEADVGKVERCLGEWARYERDRAGWELRQSDRRKAYDRRVKAQLEKKRQRLDALAEVEEQLDEVAELQHEFDTEIDEYTAAEKVLGMRGVRVQVLAHALAGIEHLANGWLSRMAPDMQLELRPFTETKTAGVTDALSLVVKGAGGGQGYKAASGGERRRIDAALILGLAEIAAAAKGLPTDGTLWFDEVFDALDTTGCAAVAECLMELGKRRSVVVITHREEIVRELDARRLVAKNGFLLPDP